MNPLIEKTAKQAGAWFPNGYPSGEGGDEYWSDSIIFSKHDLEKFAKLIVQECINALDEADGSIHHRECLLEHFAVQEPQGWVCPKCGVDRTKVACPQGHIAAVEGKCPMIAIAL